MTLLVESDAQSREVRNIGLEAGADGKVVHLVDLDSRKTGAPREVRYEITPAELIALIRAQGEELPADIHGSSAVAAP
jgi:hypothetical protein